MNEYIVTLIYETRNEGWKRTCNRISVVARSHGEARHKAIEKVERLLHERDDEVVYWETMRAEEVYKNTPWDMDEYVREWSHKLGYFGY